MTDDDDQMAQGDADQADDRRDMTVGGTGMSAARAHEERRLAVLHGYGVLDTPRQAEFDDITAMVTRACGVPISMISLVDQDRQWFLAETGLGVRQTPLDGSVCLHALDSPDLLVIDDLAADPRFASSPLVTGPPYMRFYAGVPLRTGAGVTLGVLCAVALEPRTLTRQQAFILRALARSVMAQLDTRKALADRDRALASEQEAKARTRQIIDSATDYAIISFDRDGRVTSWSEGARRILGWTEAEMAGQAFDRLFTPEDGAAGLPGREMAAALRDGHAVDDRWHMRQDGTRFLASGELTALRDEAGAPTGYVKILRDRTEQRDTLLRLRDSQAQLETALNTGLVGFFDWDTGLDIVVGDEQFAAFCNLDAARAGAGVPMAECMHAIHPCDRAAVAAQAALSRRLPADHTTQFRVAVPGRTDRHLLVHGHCYEQDHTSGPRYAGIVIDVSAARLAEAALTVSEAKYRMLFDSIDAGFCVIEMVYEGERPVDYRFVEVNAAFVDQTGLAGAAGRTMRSFAPDMEDYWFVNYGEVATRRVPTRFAANAGQLGRHFDVYAFPVDAPELRRVAVLFHDVTAPQRAREALAESRTVLEQAVAERTVELADAVESLRREAAERAQTAEVLRQSQKMEAVGQLTGGLAHDFNNLLTGIGGSLDLLRMRLAHGRTTGLERYIDAAQGAVARAAALTHRLLSFSRRQTLDPRPTDLNRLVLGMEDLIRRTIVPAIVMDMVRAPDDLWTTRVDPSQLENALLNLCLNARDAMPDGGKLTIETRNAVLDGDSTQALPAGEYVTLCVSDTGTGMSPQVIARAFDPFFTTKPLGQGTGLGLSMIYGFARQSGGQVRIASVPGAGTSVSVELPRHIGPAEGMDHAATLLPAPRAARGETLLVVDDDATVRAFLTEVLTELGYAVMEAADGAAGLRILQTEASVDLLITDVGLPGGMNGRQLADAARVARPGLLVLFVTGYAEAAVRDGHLDSGMRMLTKPFAMDMLASQVRDLLASA